MGIFDKITETLHGATAKVSMEVLDAKIGQSFQVRIKVETGDGNALKIDKVYLEIKGMKFQSDDDSITQKISTGLGDFMKTVTGKEETADSLQDLVSKETHYTKFSVAEAQSLKPSEVYVWTQEIHLPADALPTYEEKNEYHKWIFNAGLSVIGADPDTGWEEVKILNDNIKPAE